MYCGNDVCSAFYLSKLLSNAIYIKPTLFQFRIPSRYLLLRTWQSYPLHCLQYRSRTRATYMPMTNLEQRYWWADARPLHRGFGVYPFWFSIIPKSRVCCRMSLECLVAISGNLHLSWKVSIIFVFHYFQWKGFADLAFVCKKLFHLL